MTTITIVTTVLLLVVVVLVDATAIKNCCNVAVGDHYFSINKNSSGVYTIIDLCGQGTTVQGYCDTVTDGGGWLVVQRRKDGSEDFNRFWWEYEMGFGDLNREFWYGLKAMHCLTNQGQWELRIDYKFANGTRGYLYYKNFKVGPPSSQYQLTISGYSGYYTDPTVLPSQPLDGLKFTTRDKDNDKWYRNCAVDNGSNSGGWWYHSCSAIRFTNQYTSPYTIRLNNKWHNLPFLEMKIRPTSCAL